MSGRHSEPLCRSLQFRSSGLPNLNHGRFGTRLGRRPRQGAQLSLAECLGRTKSDMFWLLYLFTANCQRRFSIQRVGRRGNLCLLLLGFFGFFVATLAVVAFGHKRSFQMQRSCAGMARASMRCTPRAKFVAHGSRCIRRASEWTLLPQPRPAPFAGHEIWL
jgi:hypothetical protein